MTYTMSARNWSFETLTEDERAILLGCYPCACPGCSLRREVIAKALRICGGRSVGTNTTENDRPDDAPLKA